MLNKALIAVVGALTMAALTSNALAQSASDWTVHMRATHRVISNVTYMTATGHESKLDVYARRDTTEPQPTLVFYHGGGWVAGSKDAAVLSFLPWLEMGWNVVNVGYRLADVALAPAAVVDSICALRFVVQRAEDYGIDTERIVLSGESAGGHLALAVGMIPESAGFTHRCAGGGFRSIETAAPEVAAIINWYGITDVEKMLAGGADARSYAAQWVGAQSDAKEIARSVSPLSYVREGLPPILSIMGDADPIVPYSQNVLLHDALEEVGAKHELYTIQGGGHGNFDTTQRTEIYRKIADFLASNGL